MECSLLYVSRRIATDADVHGIVTISQVRNASLHVTGALVASRTRFAQILEGPHAGVDALMNSICRDSRHTDVEVLLCDEVDARCFPGWSLAYSGASTFIDGLIADLSDRTMRRPDAHQLQRLLLAMKELAHIAD